MKCERPYQKEIFIINKSLLYGKYRIHKYYSSVILILMLNSKTDMNYSIELLCMALVIRLLAF